MNKLLATLPATFTLLVSTAAFASDTTFDCQLVKCESVDPANDNAPGSCAYVSHFQFTVREGFKSGTYRSSHDGRRWSNTGEATASFVTNPSIGVFLESTNREIPVYVFLPYESAGKSGFKASRSRTGTVLYRSWSFGTAFTKATIQCETASR